MTVVVVVLVCMVCCCCVASETSAIIIVVVVSMQQWRQRFQNLAILWIDVLSNQVQKWTVEAVESDGVCFFLFSLFFCEFRPFRSLTIVLFF